MDGYAPGDPLVALSIAEFATVKSALLSVLTHSEAPESNSLFCTMYVPPETDAVCSWHSELDAASPRAREPDPELTATAARMPPRASSAASAVRTIRGRVMPPSVPPPAAAGQEQ